MRRSLHIEYAYINRRMRLKTCNEFTRFLNDANNDPTNIHKAVLITMIYTELPEIWMDSMDARNKVHLQKQRFEVDVKPCW